KSGRGLWEIGPAPCGTESCVSGTLGSGTLGDFMTANWAELPHDLIARVSNRFVNELAGVSRVVYDVTNKPPGTIEWE
ncbi:MAG: GMP synthase (glutamine-hydrolyzing), partial [Gammaproteobacteria bacterium]|nr:GMP synthase (glutamine-hydrolyzing) [Gammaproteobacteria bacterium]